jgi:hypothetical protein
MLFGMLDATHFRHGSSLGQTQTVRNVYIITSLRELRRHLARDTHALHAAEQSTAQRQAQR